MPQYSMGTHLSESEYSVDPVGSLNIPSFSNMTDLYMSLPQTPSIPYNSQNYHVCELGICYLLVSDINYPQAL